LPGAGPVKEAACEGNMSTTFMTGGMKSPFDCDETRSLKRVRISGTAAGDILSLSPLKAPSLSALGSSKPSSSRHGGSASALPRKRPAAGASSLGLDHAARLSPARGGTGSRANTSSKLDDVQALIANPACPLTKAGARAAVIPDELDAKKNSAHKAEAIRISQREKESKVAPSPSEVVGKRVEKYFKGQGKYLGSVVAFHARNPPDQKEALWTVNYDDGDTEDYTWPQLRRLLKAPDGRADLKTISRTDMRYLFKPEIGYPNNVMEPPGIFLRSNNPHLFEVPAPLLQRLDDDRALVCTSLFPEKVPVTRGSLLIIEAPGSGICDQYDDQVLDGTSLLGPYNFCMVKEVHRYVVCVMWS
jgi:hypothetical protein